MQSVGLGRHDKGGVERQVEGWRIWRKEGPSCLALSCSGWLPAFTALSYWMYSRYRSDVLRVYLYAVLGARWLRAAKVRARARPSLLACVSLEYIS